MRNRVLGVIGLLVLYRFLAHVPVPLANPTELKDVVANAINSTDLGGFINLLTGGSLTSFSIMLVGLSPFITASIITQLMTKAIPSLEELSNDGESGRQKINQWTRVLTIPLAIVQSVAYIFILQKQSRPPITVRCIRNCSSKIAISAYFPTVSEPSRS